jgi:hypothetical protein
MSDYRLLATLERLPCQLGSVKGIRLSLFSSFPHGA